MNKVFLIIIRDCVIVFGFQTFLQNGPAFAFLQKKIILFKMYGIIVLFMEVYDICLFNTIFFTLNTYKHYK